MTEDASRTRNGLLFGVGAYLIWGVLPIYFRALGHTLPTELVAHRIVWSILFLVAIVTLLRQWPSILAAMKSPRAMLMLSTTALLIACNWLVFIWAVDNGHVLEASLGYYLNPLVNVLIGVILLKEPLSRAQLAAVALAAVGVAVLALGSGHGIWISMTLAASFAIYGFIRKIAPVESLQGLSIETALLAPIALAWILWLESHRPGQLHRHSDDDLAAGPGRTDHRDAAAAVRRGGPAPALFDARLPAIYRADHAVPDRGAAVRRASEPFAPNLLRRDLDRAGDFRQRGDQDRAGRGARADRGGPGSGLPRRRRMLMMARC